MQKKSFLGKAVSVAASLSLAASVFPLNVSAEREVLGYMGDINHDMLVNTADLVTLSRYLLGTGSLDGGEYNADLDKDGYIDSFDLVLLRQYVVGIKEKEPILGEEITTTTTTTATTTTTTTTSLADITTTTTTVYYEDEFIDAPIKQVEAYLPSQGEGNLVIFYVDFPDCKYDYAPSESEIDKIAFGEEDLSDANYPFDSMSAFYSRSSKGAMNLQGKTFRYTTKENQSAYDTDKAKLAMECYNAFKDSEDFSRFDGDHDGYIDATLFTVPTKAGDTDWWPCAGPLGRDEYSVDGVRVGHIITGNAQIESTSDYYNFNSSYLHEMGHCMGLPDYYLYTGDDSEGLHGVAGNELMDTDASSDFSAVSKIQLGWFRKSQIQVYDSSQGSQTFTLSNAQKDGGNCVIIPNGTLDSKYNSEYFVIEFATTDRNNSKPQWWQKTDSGVRVYHVSAELYDNGWWVSYKYASGSEFTNNNNGRRLIRIIDDTDTDNFYRTGDVVDSSISGFKWYDSSDNLTVDPGLKITVGAGNNDTYEITIDKK